MPRAHRRVRARRVAGRCPSDSEELTAVKERSRSE